MKTVYITNNNTGNRDFALMSDEDADKLVTTFEDSEDVDVDAHLVTDSNLDDFEDVMEWDVINGNVSW